MKKFIFYLSSLCFATSVIAYILDSDINSIITFGFSSIYFLLLFEFYDKLKN